MDGGAALFTEFRDRIDALSRRRATFRPSRARRACRCTCVSAPCRSASLPHSRMRARSSRGGEGARTWLSELAWREFFAQVLWHRPDVVDHSYRPEYEHLRFAQRSRALRSWCEGRTGIRSSMPRCASSTRPVHAQPPADGDRIVPREGPACDWRWGERYFADKLLDYDLASNNGNWQWAASTGCDAQPYFRIFNPVAQSERFDADGAYIRRFVPELRGLDGDAIHAPWKLAPDAQHAKGVVVGRDYPAPIVDHASSRAARARDVQGGPVCATSSSSASEARVGLTPLRRAPRCYRRLLDRRVPWLPRLPHARARGSSSCARSRFFLSTRTPAHAFCGFFVGKADATLFNEASQVIMVRRRQPHRHQHGERLPRRADGVRAGRAGAGGARAQPDHDRRPQALRAHRRVQRAAARRVLRSRSLLAAEDELRCDAQMPAPAAAEAAAQGRRDKALGVTVEAQLHRRRVRHRDPSAHAVRRARDLAARERLPDPEGAASALRPYVRQQMKFFVAKVNLEEQAQTGVA